MTAAPPSCGLGCQVRVTLFEVTSVTTGFWGGPGSCRDCETRGMEDVPVAKHKKQSQMWLRQRCFLVQGHLTAHWNHPYNVFLEVSDFSKSYRELCYREECLYYLSLSRSHSNSSHQWNWMQHRCTSLSRFPSNREDKIISERWRR